MTTSSFLERMVDEVLLVLIVSTISACRCVVWLKISSSKCFAGVPFWCVNPACSHAWEALQGLSHTNQRSTFERASWWGYDQNATWVGEIYDELVTLQTEWLSLVFWFCWTYLSGKWIWSETALQYIFLMQPSKCKELLKWENNLA